jgi:hypothetical protein
MHFARWMVWACVFASNWAVASQADNFEQRCERLARTASVSVSFEDTSVTWDTRRSAEELKKLGPAQGNPYHTVLGLTHAQPTANVQVSHRSLSHPEGGTCIVGDVRLTLSFAELRVYLATELTNPCRRQIVEDHEAEHVRIYRNHFRAGARLAEPLIKKMLILPIYASDAEAAEAELRRHTHEVVMPIATRITKVAMAANLEIDTPASYREVSARLRACP